MKTYDYALLLKVSSTATDVQRISSLTKEGLHSQLVLGKMVQNMMPRPHSKHSHRQQGHQPVSRNQGRVLKPPVMFLFLNLTASLRFTIKTRTYHPHFLLVFQFYTPVQLTSFVNCTQLVGQTCIIHLLQCWCH